MLSINELMFQIDFEYTMPKYDNGSVPNRNFKLFFPYRTFWVGRGIHGIYLINLI